MVEMLESFTMRDFSATARTTTFGASWRCCDGNGRNGGSYEGGAMPAMASGTGTTLVRDLNFRHDLQL
jgi:hypothetical protein